MNRTLLTQVLTISTLAGCQHTHCDPQPTSKPACVSGTVAAITCMDGPLIAVDAAYAIGAPGLTAYGQHLGNNVIAVVNRDLLGSGIGSVGQRLYFTYVNDPNQHWNGLMCLAADGTQQPVPHLVLRNVSATPCQTTTRSN